MACLGLAAGGPVWAWPSPDFVAVMVDLSPSTRTADFRARSRLQARIKTLLGETPYRVYGFAATTVPLALADAALSEMPADKTVFEPPAGASAVVLFSDARFDLPITAPPTYIVLDPRLESPIDAAIGSLDVRGGHVAVQISNSGSSRQLTLDGTDSAARAIVPAGAITLVRPIDARATEVAARLTPGDAWPENDQLTAIPLKPERPEQWWVGPSPPKGNWRAFSPSSLPTDSTAYLAPSVIILQNIAATDLAVPRLQRLGQYVRDLGGGLVVLGGDHAFAAGAYPGSELEALLPLASTPPTPTTHWMLLADGSGSMAEVHSGSGLSLWQQAADAMTRLVPHLPADDPVNIGSFSDTLIWWSVGKSARQTASLSFPPPGVGPHGPTNLEDTLLNLARSADADLPKYLLLLTDAEAEITQPLAVAEALKQKKIHLHLLATGNGSALPALEIIIGATGGTLVRQFEPARWAEAVQTLMCAGQPRWLGADPLAVRFQDELSSLSPREVLPWNRTWKKESARLMAQGTDAGQPVPGAAEWNVGQGRVLALAFDPGPQASDVLARVAGRPRAIHAIA